MLAVGIAGLLLSRRLRPAERPVRIWLVAALLVGVICWIPPAIEQATNDPGNARLIYRAVRADQATLGFDAGWRAVVHGVGVLPWWLRDPQYGLERVVDLSEIPATVAIASTALMLIGLLGLGGVAWRRRRGDVMAAVAIALVLSAALLVATASTPLDSFATVGYTLGWAAPAGMWIWLAAGWSLAALFLGRPLAARLPARVPAVAGLAAVVAAAAVVGISGELKQKSYENMGTIADRLEGQLPDGDSAAIVASGNPDAAFMALSFEAGVTYVLRREGRAVTVPPLSNYLGPEYRRGGYDHVVRLDIGTPPPAGARPIARVVVQEGERRTPVTVTVQPAARRAAGER